ncbi:MAG: hypothetical protein EOQ40_02145 [Mesorhizobium sp.]|nr:MAG: hypothetical protein EOQ40_02145 [Mesorhizobium sp.]
MRCSYGGWTGHLLRKEGDRMSPSLSPIADVEGEVPSTKLPISPLAGEMAGRPEGGAQARPPKSVQTL